MDLHMAAVECHLSRHVRRSGDGGEHRLPNAPFAPACEAVVDGFVRPILTRTILPATPNPLDMHDPAQNPTVIFSRWPRLVGRQMRPDLRPLFVGEPKQVLVHRLASESVDQHVESTNG